MTIAEWCVFGTLMLYLLTIASVKWAGHRHFDNARSQPTAERAQGRFGHHRIDCHCTAPSQ